MSSFSGSITSSITAESTICNPTGTNLFASSPSLGSSEQVTTSNSDAHLTYEDDEVSEGEFHPEKTQTDEQDSSEDQDSSEGQELLLYVKGNTKTKALKDCAYCHTILLAMEEKNIPYRLELIDPRKKPQWMVDANPSGFLPLLKDGAIVVHESRKILDYLEAKYPQPALPQDEDGMSAGGGVFAAFRRFLLNKDNSRDGVLQERLETELGVMNDYLERVEDEGWCFGGNSYNAADVALLPRLYRMKVALKSFKEWEIPTSLNKVSKYLEEACQQPSWRKTVCDEEDIKTYWRNHLFLRPTRLEK